MRTQYIHAVFALFVVPCSSVGINSIHSNAALDKNCEAPVLANDHILLQGRAALHLSQFAGGDAEKKHEFIEATPEHLRGSNNMEVRRRHLNTVLEQSADLVRQGAGAIAMASAGREMEAVDEKVLPEILADHEQATLMLDLQWSGFKLVDGHVEMAAKSVSDRTDEARKLGATYLECRVEEGQLLRAAEKCEKELQSLDIKTHPHGDHRVVGAHEAGQHQHSKTDQHLYMVKEGECGIKRTALQMQRGQCELDQRTVEQHWCLVQKLVDSAHGKLADSYAMALTRYEAVVSHIETEEAARKAEFGVVEVIRCLKEHFLASVEGSVAEASWIAQCNDAASESSGLDMSYAEPSAAAAAVSIAPEDLPCTAAFIHARNTALPTGVQGAPCTPCMASHQVPHAATSIGHMGLSERFWTGFNKGVQAVSGQKQSDAAHIEEFQKKLSEEGADGNFARFKASFAQKVSDRLPGDWGKSTDMDLHHGFMNGLEAGFNSHSGLKKWHEAEAASQEFIDEHLDHAAQALKHALEKVETVAPSDYTVMASSGFQKVSESAKVLSSSSMVGVVADSSGVPEVLPFDEV